MPFSPEELLAKLESLNIDVATHHHPALKTVEESMALRGDLAGVHSKNLFLKDKKKKFWLVVAREDLPINLKELKDKIGSAHLSFAKPESLYDLLGVRPGSVTPFALINDPEHHVNVVLDADMMQSDLVNFHPLINTMTTALHPEGLRIFLRDCGHDFHEVAL